MNKLEPTYLRYVYDGLNKGFLNAENAAALPQGFIGLFESEFPADMLSTDRISILRRLTLWALFKGAVSTHLASEVLKEDEEDTKTLIDTYSKWFNSPEPGKYILYHDRLRSYFLQKLSSHEVQTLNEKLVAYLEKAIEANNKDEAEAYALEHLATHMAVESQLDNNYDRLHDFVNQETLWPRQVRASKEYKWSQQAVQYGIKEGARRHHEMNTLKSTVNSVKLMQEEQNSSSDIFSILADGDMDLVFQRLESFDSRKQGKLYLLMIHELTLGELKSSVFRKEACVSIIEKLRSSSDKIDMDFDFIQEIAIYEYHIELSNMGIDDSILWYKTSNKPTDEYEGGQQLTAVDLESLLDYNVDLKVVERLSLKIIKKPSILVKIFFKIINKYSSKINTEEGKYKKEISCLLRLIVKQIDLDYHESNYKKVIDLLIVYEDLDKIDFLIDRYVSLSLSIIPTYEVSDHMKDYNHDAVIQEAALFYTRIDKHKRAKSLYDDIKTNHYKYQTTIDICKLLFQQNKQKELIVFLKEVELERTRINALLEICSILIDRDRVNEALDIILSDNNMFQDVSNSELTIYDYLIQIKEAESIQERFNCRSLYLKTYMILNSNRDNLKLKFEEFNYHWLIHQAVYLNRCRNDKELMIRDLNDFLSKVITYKDEIEIDKAIKVITDEIDSQLVNIDPSIRKLIIYQNYLFSLFLYDLSKAKEVLTKLELDTEIYWAKSNPPAIIKHNDVWSKFNSRFDKLCEKNDSIALKIIEQNIYPTINGFPGKSLDTPLYVRLINALISKREVNKAINIYDKLKDIRPHKEFYCNKAVKNSVNIYDYINSETGELIESGNELQDQRFSVEEIYSFCKELSIQCNLEEARRIFNDLKCLYPDFKEKSYRKIIFNGMIEFDKEAEKAFSYLRGFMFDSSNHHFNINVKVKSTSQQESSSLKEHVGSLKPSQMKDIDYRFISVAIKKELLYRIFNINDIRGYQYTDKKRLDFYKYLYYTLAYNNQFHLVIEDIIEVNFESQLLDMYEFVSSIKNYEGKQENIVRCLNDDLNEKKGVMYYNNIPFTGIVFELYSNKSLKFETEYKEGLKDGFYKNYSKDGYIEYSLDYKDNKIDLNCFSKNSALSFVKGKLLEYKSDNVDVLALLEKNVRAKELINNLEKDLQEVALPSKISHEATQILSHINSDKHMYWDDYGRWEAVMKNITDFNKDSLKRLEKEINLKDILENGLEKHIIKDSFNVKASGSKVFNSADKVDEYTKHVRSLAWLSEFLRKMGHHDKSLEVLNLSLQNANFFNEEDLVKLIEGAYLDPYFYSIKVLINGFVGFNKYDIVFDILESITNTFSSYIYFSNKDIKLNDIPQYGAGHYELYCLYHDISTVLWKKDMQKELSNLFDLIKNKKWIKGIKSDLLLLKEEINPLENLLINEIETINKDLSKILNSSAYKYISDFNLYVNYAEKLIHNQRNNNAIIYLKKAKEIKDSNDNEFQASIRTYNSISDSDENWYEKEASVTPKLEKFYLNRVSLEDSQQVIEEIILEEESDFVDTVTGYIVPRYWENERWHETNCYDLISNIYDQEDKLDESFRYAFKIIDDENRQKQFDKILDRLELNKCIELINLNQDSNNFIYFSKYLAKRISNSFNNKDLEFTYLSNYYENTNHCMNILEYKVLNTCFSKENFDEKKLDNLSEVFYFDKYREISREVMKIL